MTKPPPHHKYNVVALYEVSSKQPLGKHVEEDMYFSYAVERARSIIRVGFSEYLGVRGNGMYSRFVPPHRVFEVSKDEYND